MFHWKININQRFLWPCWIAVAVSQRVDFSQNLGKGQDSKSWIMNSRGTLQIVMIYDYYWLLLTIANYFACWLLLIINYDWLLTIVDYCWLLVVMLIVDKCWLLTSVPYCWLLLILATDGYFILIADYYCYRTSLST